MFFVNSNDALGLLRFPGLKIETWGTRLLMNGVVE
jgi:hypothetical protein